MRALKRQRVSPITLMCEIAIMAAAGFILDELAGAMFKGVFVNGGSIGIAMVVVVLMCFRRGPISGFLVGLIIGLFDLMTGPYMIAASPWKVIVQVLLDYVLAYPFVALAAVMKPAFDRATDFKGRAVALSIAIVLGTLGKLLCHFLSGILFWADPSGFAWGLTAMNPFLYCFLYNAAFMLPCGFLTTVTMILMLRQAPQLYLLKGHQTKEVTKRSLTHAESIVISLIGFVAVGSFVYYLTRYIQSFYYGDYGEYGSEFSFDVDAMAAWIASFLMVGLCLVTLLVGRKGKYRPRGFLYGLMFLGGVVAAYALSRLVKLAIKGQDYTSYFMNIGAGALMVLTAWAYAIFLSPIDKAKPID